MFGKGIWFEANKIRLGTPGKVNKGTEGSLMISQLRNIFRLVSAWGWWQHNSALLEPCQFSKHSWYPSWCSYLLKQAGVPNLFLSTLFRKSFFQWNMSPQHLKRRRLTRRWFEELLWGCERCRWAGGATRLWCIFQTDLRWWPWPLNKKKKENE